MTKQKNRRTKMMPIFDESIFIRISKRQNVQNQIKHGKAVKQNKTMASSEQKPCW